MSRPLAILDTGPLVAFLNEGDPWHDWAIQQFRSYRPPLLICEPVLTEAAFLLRSWRGGQEGLLGLLGEGAIAVGLTIQENLPAIAFLMGKYADVPMSLADACLVRMSELQDAADLITFDSDFRIYRRNGRQIIPVAMPGDRRDD